MRIKGNDKTVGSPMETNSRRVVKAMEEEREEEVIATSVV
ncbi:hypothetical protein A2U01_0098222, partial [Trifolium medium]|nr:hypothetical protein [Trifolium medium]